jgi:hypothetical protein
VPEAFSDAVTRDAIPTGVVVRRDRLPYEAVWSDLGTGEPPQFFPNCMMCGTPDGGLHHCFCDFDLCPLCGKDKERPWLCGHCSARFWFDDDDDSGGEGERAPVHPPELVPA